MSFWTVILSILNTFCIEFFDEKKIIWWLRSSYRPENLQDSFFHVENFD